MGLERPVDNFMAMYCHLIEDGFVHEGCVSAAAAKGLPARHCQADHGRAARRQRPPGRVPRSARDKGGDLHLAESIRPAAAAASWGVLGIGLLHGEQWHSRGVSVPGATGEGRRTAG